MQHCQHVVHMYPQEVKAARKMDEDDAKVGVLGV